MSVYCIVLCFIVLRPVYYVLLCCASLSTNKDNNNNSTLCTVYSR